MTSTSELCEYQQNDLLFFEIVPWGPFNNYVDKMRGGGGQKMSVFVQAQGIKTVHAGGKGAKILST